MSQNFTVFEPLENIVKTVDGVSQLGTSFSFIGKNTTTNTDKTIQIIGPQASNVKNYDYYWPSSTPSVGQNLSVSSVSYNSDGDLETVTFGWISGGAGGDVFTQDTTNLYNTSVGAPVGVNNFIAGVNAAANLQGSNSVIIGYSAGSANLYDDNIVLGYQALNSVSSYVAGANTTNVAIGTSALTNANGVSAGQNKGNICIGDETGITITTGSGNICIGENADVSVLSASNQIVIGQNTVGKGNNTVLLGNSSVTDVYIGSGNPGNPASLALYGDDASGTSFFFKIKAPTNPAMNSNRQIILPSAIPVFGNLLQVASVSTAGGITSATVNWTDRPQLVDVFLNNNNIAQDTILQYYNNSATNNNFLYFFKDRPGGLIPFEVMGQEVKYGYNSAGTFWAGMSTYTFCNSSTAGAETASTTWESMNNGTLSQVFGFIGHDIYLPKISANRILYTDASNYLGGAVLQGTSNQVTVSGIGTSTITLSTPQDIGTTSSPQFRGVTLSGSTSGTIGLSAGTSPTSYTITLPSTAGTSGYALTTNGSGTTSWTAPSSIAVPSITGTANQVLVNGTSGSAQTGAITLTLPQNMATTGGVMFNSLSLGGADGPVSGAIGFPSTVSGTVFLAGPTVSLAPSSYTLRLPPNTGTNNYVLTTNGSGATSWQNIGTIFPRLLTGTYLFESLYATTGVSTGGYLQIANTWKFTENVAKLELDNINGGASTVSLFKNTNSAGAESAFKIFSADGSNSIVHALYATNGYDSYLCANGSNLVIGGASLAGYKCNVIGSLNSTSLYINGTQTQTVTSGTVTGFPLGFSGVTPVGVDYTIFYSSYPTTGVVFFNFAFPTNVTSSVKNVSLTFTVPIGAVVTGAYGTVSGLGNSSATSITIPASGSATFSDGAITLNLYFAENLLLGSTCYFFASLSYKQAV